MEPLELGLRKFGICELCLQVAIRSRAGIYSILTSIFFLLISIFYYYYYLDFCVYSQNYQLVGHLAGSVS